MGRWRHTRAALPVLRASWMLPSRAGFAWFAFANRSCLSGLLCLWKKAHHCGAVPKYCRYVGITLCPSSPVLSWSTLSSVWRHTCGQHLYHPLGHSAFWGKELDFEKEQKKNVWAEFYLWPCFVLFSFLHSQVKKVFQLYRRLSSEELHAATFYRTTLEAPIYTWPTKWKASPNPA